MADEVLSVITKWQSIERLTLLDEAKVKQVVILPIFRGLRWDPDNDQEVCPEYSVAGRRVDYALLIGKTPKVFIEVKKGGEPLENHQEQLLNYSFKEGVKIAVLTNGATWWFYLPIRAVSWERRKVATVELDRQDSTELAQKLADLLGKENVESRAAIQKAERHQISEYLPTVWNKLVSEPDNSIVNLLAERTHRLCVRQPARNEVEEFFSTHLQQMQITSPPDATEPDSPPEPIVVPEPAPQPNPSGISERATFRAFTFCGNRHEVSSWRNMLVKLCEIIHTAHRNQFGDVLSLRGRGGATYFSRDSNDFIAPKRINETDIFVEINLSADSIRKRAQALIIHFGYDESDLSYETQMS